MISRKSIHAFLAAKTIAVAGVSRKKEKFGNTLYKELKKRNYRVFGLHTAGIEVDGDPTYAGIAALPEPVQGLVINVKPEKTLPLVEAAVQAGIDRIWLQQGAESDEAIRLCAEKGIDVVHGHCLLMFLEPVAWFHRLHRWFMKLSKKLPA